MLKFLNLFLSQSGCIGRATWWWLQLVVVILAIILALSLNFTQQRVKDLSNIQGVKNSPYLHSLTVAERNQEKRDKIALDSNIVAVLIAAVVLLIWSHICIEVKRWHDLGLSGYWIWIRLFPPIATAALGPLVGAIATLAVPIGTLYFLGFRPGIYDDIPELLNPPQSAWDHIKNIGGAILVFALVISFCRWETAHNESQDIDDAQTYSTPDTAN